MIAQRKKQNFASFKKPRPDLIYYILYLSFVKFLYTVPGDGLKSVPIVTFYVKLDADSEFYIFKFLSLFVCLL